MALAIATSGLLHLTCSIAGMDGWSFELNEAKGTVRSAYGPHVQEFRGLFSKSQVVWRDGQSTLKIDLRSKRITLDGLGMKNEVTHQEGPCEFESARL